jgi:hypothetical protein
MEFVFGFWNYIYFQHLLWYCDTSSEIIQNVAYDDYDDFQHVNFIFSQNFISLFFFWGLFHDETDLRVRYLFIRFFQGSSRALRASHWCSVVTVHIKIGWRKSQNMLVELRKMVLLLQSFPLFVETGKRHNKVVHLLHKNVIIMTCLLVPVFDWPNIMIGLGGLL